MTGQYFIVFRGAPMENKTHAGNYKGTAHMSAENQDMAFVNDVLEKEASEQTIRGTNQEEEDEE
ncbi:hypothetical protein ACI5FR_00350 [Paenibacillus sp. HJGM_3]